MLNSSQDSTCSCMERQAASADTRFNLPQTSVLGVTATCSPRDVDVVHSYGATTVVDYRDPLPGTNDVDVVLDTVGGDVISRSWRVLRARGILISVAEEPQTPAGSDAIGRYFVVEPNGEQLTRLASLVDQGALRPVISRVLPFVEANGRIRNPEGAPIRQDHHPDGHSNLSLRGW